MLYCVSLSPRVVQGEFSGLLVCALRGSVVLRRSDSSPRVVQGEFQGLRSIVDDPNLQEIENFGIFQGLKGKLALQCLRIPVASSDVIGGLS